MTSNEKKVLVKFKEIEQGNTVTVAGTLRVTISYAYDVCKKLCEKGYLERLSPGRFALYRITPLGAEQVKTDVPTKEAGATEDSAEKPFVSAHPCPREHSAELSRSPQQRDNLHGECTTESFDSCRDEEPSQAVPGPSAILGINPVESKEEKTGILNHSSVPQEWKTCNWNWK